MSTATGEEVSRFDAENATSHTVDFLKRLGYKQSWQPMKVSMDGDLYIVEMMFQKLTAKVQINSKTKEVKEYELQENQEEKTSFLSSRKLLFIVAGALAAVIVLQFLGVF
jgi:hypothetical protein